MIEEVNELRWKIGWSPPIAIGAGGITGLIVAGAMGTVGGGVVLGIVLGAGLWVWGSQEVKTKSPEIIQELERRAAENAKETLSTKEGDWYHFVTGAGHSPLVEPAKKYKTNHLLVRDNSIAIHTGAELDMKNLRVKHNDSYTEFYYEDIDDIKSYKRNSSGVTSISLEVSSVGGKKSKLKTYKKLEEILDAEEKIRSNMRQARREGT